MHSPLLLPAPELRDFAEQVFSACGVHPPAAGIAADVLMWASLRGVDTHGLRNLKRYYADELQAGRTRVPADACEVVSETASTAVLEGAAQLGLVTAERAMRRAIAKAADQGVAMVCVRNSRHLGAAGYYAQLAAEHEMLGFCATGYFFPAGQDTAVLPFGGSLPMLSTNPLAIACPAGDLPTFVLDMSTSTAPVNRIELQAERGQPIPAGWACDADGRATTDPRAARQLLPLGGELAGHKGYGLALAVQLLTGMLSGAWKQFPSPDLLLTPNQTTSDGYGQEGVAHCFAAIRIDAFASPQAFRQGVDALIRALNHAPARGGERVLVPGQREAEIAADRTDRGIPLSPSEHADLASLASTFGLSLPPAC